MSFDRSQVGEIELRVSLYRNGERLENEQGAYDLQPFVRGVEIYESIEQATLECMLIIEDAAGLLGALTGSEIFQVIITTNLHTKTYNFRSYEISSRSRTNQNNDIYIVNCASNEYIKNEITNVFGNSDTIFNNKTEASQIVKHLLKNQKYIGSEKNVFVPETLNKHQLIIPNWRVFDTIYWIAQRTIRKKASGKGFQNGFAFFENGLGFHFKAIDKMIDDINDMSPKDKTNKTTGKCRLYNYEYTPKKSDEGVRDTYKIDKVVFPNERNFLNGLRHGTWSGYSIGFDPVTISSSIMGTSTDMSVDAYRYSLKETWKSMSHIGGEGTTNPFSKSDQEIQNMTDYPKRVRYTFLPNQNFDKNWFEKFSGSDFGAVLGGGTNKASANYAELVELQAYQWMRFESLKNIKLQVEVPGNLDLYVGSGVEITLPSTSKSGNKTPLDRKYSGRYMIAALTHKTTGLNMTTEMFLVKDSVLK